jgi:hypothetical protein
VKFLRPPRVSQTPSSGWSQLSQTQLTSVHSSSQRRLEMGVPHLLYRYTESMRAP